MRPRTFVVSVFVTFPLSPGGLIRPIAASLRQSVPRPCAIAHRPSLGGTPAACASDRRSDGCRSLVTRSCGDWRSGHEERNSNGTLMDTGGAGMKVMRTLPVPTVFASPLGNPDAYAVESRSLHCSFLRALLTMRIQMGATHGEHRVSLGQFVSRLRRRFDFHVSAQG